MDIGFEEEMKVGTFIDIVASPKTIGLDWSYSITELKFNGKTYLDFETGKNNLVAFVKVQEKKSIKFRNIIIPIFA